MQPALQLFPQINKEYSERDSLFRYCPGGSLEEVFIKDRNNLLNRTIHRLQIRASCYATQREVLVFSPYSKMDAAGRVRKTKHWTFSLDRRIGATACIFRE
jgi:ABC-type uncharacterized transport system YnjBCD ATPase subunit